MRHLLLAFIALAIAVPAMARTPSLALAQEGVPRPDAMQQGVSPCVIEGRKSVDPGAVLVGERVTVTLHARATCTGLGVPLHIVMVLDASLSMSGF